MKVLVLTVGGSPGPVISAYSEFQPDFTYFVCSKGYPPHGTEGMVDGEGDPCGDKRTVECRSCGQIVNLGDPKGKCLVKQLNIPTDAYKKIVVNDPDNLYEVYEAMLEVHREVNERFRPHHKAICYTGGTKTMTAGAVLLGIRYPDWDVALEKGPRQDVHRVRDGSIWWPQDVTSVYADIQLAMCEPLLKRYEYDTVDQLLGPLQQSRTLSPEKRHKVYRLKQLCQAFGLWDRFEHEKALKRLEMLGSREIGPWIHRSKVLASTVRKPNPFQAVADLVMNAERRAVQEKFSDAVARLYRAVEMLAQARLKEKHNQDTSNICPERLPEAIRPKYIKMKMADEIESGNIKMSLCQAYDLLLDLDDKLGQHFLDHRRRVGDALSIRNQSISGHGVVPVTEEHYRRCSQIYRDFIEKGLKVCAAVVDWTQLPGAELIRLAE